VQLQFVDALGDGCLGTGQKTRAYPVGDLTQAQIEARRLDLVGIEVARAHDAAGIGQPGDRAVGQDAFLVGAVNEAHRSRLLSRPREANIHDPSSRGAAGDEAIQTVLFSALDCFVGVASSQ